MPCVSWNHLLVRNPRFKLIYKVVVFFLLRKISLDVVRLNGQKTAYCDFYYASLPRMTGMAVNPLFCAAYPAKDGERKVTVIPWLSLKHQKLVYPGNIMFSSPQEQKSCVRQRLEERIRFTSFIVRFYPGKVIIPVIFLYQL